MYVIRGKYTMYPGQYLQGAASGNPRWTSIEEATVYNTIPEVIRAVFLWGYNFPHSVGVPPSSADYIIEQVEQRGIRVVRAIE